MLERPERVGWEWTNESSRASGGGKQVLPFHSCSCSAPYYSWRTVSHQHHVAVAAVAPAGSVLASSEPPEWLSSLYPDPQTGQGSWDWTGYLHTQDALLKACEVRILKIILPLSSPLWNVTFSEQGRGTFTIKKIAVLCKEHRKPEQPSCAETFSSWRIPQHANLSELSTHLTDEGS